MLANDKSNQIPAGPSPEHRRLQIFAIDPSAEIMHAASRISRCTLQIRWEELKPGPVGEYIEVVDVDPSSNAVYAPVDLDAYLLLAKDGLAPSEGNPQFHQQMVYAVIMKTIENFERALGRRVLWSERFRDENGALLKLKADERFVPRLRIYPHALREANAYYSPVKKAILLGYFNAPLANSVGTHPEQHSPSGVVFTCLSHDVLAHETTHAILDGIHRRLLEVTNHDVLAFHEGFADIVAVFQHFSLPGLVLDQIQRSRGDLSLDSFLAKLAVQFGQATQNGGALRNALGQFDKNKSRKPPDPSRLGRTLEPHQRGAILVAAIFDAFLKIYDDRILDLRRIATQGTGILPPGDIHPDLAARFANEATKVAQQMLTICIRALDYLPPVDVTFGDYLRAIITADYEVVRDDPRRYRVAILESFQNHGIYPFDVRAMGEDSLRWRSCSAKEMKDIESFIPPPEIIRTMVSAWEYAEVPQLPQSTEGFHKFKKAVSNADLAAMHDALIRSYWLSPPKYSKKSPSDRRRHIHLMERQFKQYLSYCLQIRVKTSSNKTLRKASRVLGVDLIRYQSYLERRHAGDRKNKDGIIDIHAIRPILRGQPDGRSKAELLVILTQTVTHFLRNENDEDCVDVDSPSQRIRFLFRSGSTILIDPLVGQVRYIISKGMPFEEEQQQSTRLKRVVEFYRDQFDAIGNLAIDRCRLFVGSSNVPGCGNASEPLAMLHRGLD